MNAIGSEMFAWTRRKFLRAVGLSLLLGGLPRRRSRGASEALRLRLGFIPVYPMMQFFIARELGWYRELGLELEETRFGSGPPIVQAFAAEQLDLAYIGIAPALVAIARGVPAKVVAANVREPNVILAGEAFAALWEEKGQEAFRQFKEARGRRVRFVTLPKGSTPDLLLRFWIIEKLGLELEDVLEIVPVGAPQVLQALAAGGVDGASLIEPAPTLVEAHGLPFRPIVYAREVLPGQPGAVVLVTQALIEERPELVEELVKLHMRATAFVRLHPQRAAELASRVIGPEVLPVEVALRALKSPASCFISDPHAIEAGTLVYNDFQNRLGIVNRRLSPEEIFDYRFYDRLAEEHPELDVSEC